MAKDHRRYLLEKEVNSKLFIFKRKLTCSIIFLEYEATRIAFSAIEAIK